MRPTKILVGQRFVGLSPGPRKYATFSSVS
jgi:hypothetical protein